MIIHDVEQNSPEWHLVRAGIPTASEFKKLLSGLGKESDSLPDYGRVLATEIYTGRASSSFAGNYHTKRGHELEPVAVEEYELVNGKSASTVGFITNNEKTCGCSPDRLIGSNGVLEIKSLSDKEHFLVLEYYDKHGDIEPLYKPQLQGELMLTQRQWNDIMFFHPDLPSLTFRVLPDEVYQEKLKKQIARVIKERDHFIAFLRKFSVLPTQAPIQESKLVMEI